MSFGGFSDEDIQKLQQDNIATDSSDTSRESEVKSGLFEQNSPPNISRTRKFVQGDKPYKQIHLPEAKRLATSLLKSLNTINKETLTRDSLFKAVIHDNKRELKEIVPVKSNLARPAKQDSEKCLISQSSPRASTYSFLTTEPVGVNVEEFEKKRRYIEAENRKRKELITKALADRTKKTHDEAQRLNEIQSELKKLDASLANDITILRKQIETAISEYSLAEKKFHRAEKEYLESKLLLAQKLERKDLLTEHLCTIIQKNEERKAEKLNELLDKLSIGSAVSLESNITNLKQFNVRHDGPRVETVALNTDITRIAH